MHWRELNSGKCAGNAWRQLSSKFLVKSLSQSSLKSLEDAQWRQKRSLCFTAEGSGLGGEALLTNVEKKGEKQLLQILVLPTTQSRALLPFQHPCAVWSLSASPRTGSSPRSPPHSSPSIPFLPKFLSGPKRAPRLTNGIEIFCSSRTAERKPLGNWLIRTKALPVQVGQQGDLMPASSRFCTHVVGAYTHTTVLKHPS